MNRSEPRLRSHSLVSLAMLALAGAAAASCAPRSRYTVPASSRAISATSDMDASFDASLQGVADANMMVKQQDRAAGVIRTEWQETFVRYSAGSPPSRRLRFDVTVSPGNVTVAPRAEICSDIDADVGCEPASHLNEEEAQLAARLTNTIEANIRDREVAMGRRPAEYRTQSGRDRVVIAHAPPAAPAPVVVAPAPAPAPHPQGSTQVIVNPPAPQAPVVVAPAAPARPSQQGPLLIETRRAGKQEVAAGRDVEVTTVNGNRLSGKILFVAPEGIVVDVGTGETVTIWARDIEQIHFL